MYGGDFDQGFGESIYSIIPPKPVLVEKPPMHRSKHHGLKPPSCSTFHTQGSTMPALSNLTGLSDEKPVEDLSARSFGPQPGSARNHPANYMRKASKTEKVATLEEVKRTKPDLLKPTNLAPRHKPAVPRRDEKPIFNLVTSKNFIVANAVDNILATPRKPTDGTKDYLHKEDYGKTPKYLAHIKQDIQDEFNYIRELQQQREDMRRSLVQPLQEGERENLIEGLKARWEQANQEYQATTHLTKLDTIGKIKRKGQYEADLSQIEKDIEKLNRKNILVDSTY